MDVDQTLSPRQTRRGFELPPVLLCASLTNFSERADPMGSQLMAGSRLGHVCKLGGNCFWRGQRQDAHREVVAPGEPLPAWECHPVATPVWSLSPDVKLGALSEAFTPCSPRGPQRIRGGESAARGAALIPQTDSSCLCSASRTHGEELMLAHARPLLYVFLLPVAGATVGLWLVTADSRPSSSSLDSAFKARAGPGDGFFRQGSHLPASYSDM